MNKDAAIDLYNAAVLREKATRRKLDALVAAVRAVISQLAIDQHDWHRGSQMHTQIALTAGALLRALAAAQEPAVTSPSEGIT